MRVVRRTLRCCCPPKTERTVPGYVCADSLVHKHKCSPNSQAIGVRLEVIAENAYVLLVILIVGFQLWDMWPKYFDQLNRPRSYHQAIAEKCDLVDVQSPLSEQISKWTLHPQPSTSEYCQTWRKRQGRSFVLLFFSMNDRYYLAGNECQSRRRRSQLWWFDNVEERCLPPAWQST